MKNMIKEIIIEIIITNIDGIKNNKKEASVMKVNEKINNGRELKKIFEPSKGGIGKILYIE